MITVRPLRANEGRLNGVSGWFLPSRDELALLYRNLKAAGVEFPVGGARDNVSCWTSSQETADMASWRRTSTSRTTAVSITMTKIFHAACGRRPNTRIEGRRASKNERSSGSAGSSAVIRAFREIRGYPRPCVLRSRPPLV